MEGTLYRHILRESWKITRRNPRLWLLGALSVFWGGIGAYSSLDAIVGRIRPALPGYLQEGTLPAVSDFSPNGLAVVILLAILMVLLTAAFLVLVTSARGGLIFALGRVKERRSIRIVEALKSGRVAFWPLLGIGLLSRLDIPLSALMLAPLGRIAPAPWVLLLYVLAFVVVTVLSLILALLAMYAMAYVMMERLPFAAACRQSWELFCKHWLVSFELALFLYALNLLVGLAVLSGLIALSIPFALLGILFAFLNVPGGILVVAIPLLIVYAVILVIAGSAFVTFQYAAWTLLYLRLQEGSAVAKVMRVTARFAHILHRRIV